MTDLIPILAGQVTLAQFKAVCLAIGLVAPFKREQLSGVLQEERGNISATARRMRVCNKTIYRWIRASGLSVKEIRASERRLTGTRLISPMNRP